MSNRDNFEINRIFFRLLKILQKTMKQKTWNLGKNLRKLLTWWNLKSGFFYTYPAQIWEKRIILS